MLHKIEFILETFTEITSCQDFSKYGYEGYKCTPASRCKDGYIVSDAIDELYLIDPYRRNDGLDASNFGCQIRKRRSEYDDYYTEDYFYPSYDQEMICCRDPQFFGKGIVYEI